MQDQVRQKICSPFDNRNENFSFLGRDCKVAYRKGYSSQIFETLKCSKKKMFDRIGIRFI